jgi:DNA-binding IclR family transcriptional regulator
MPAAIGTEVVHHVFRPDGSPQRLRTGQVLPLHATAVGKCLLAFAPVAVPPLHQLDLQRYTGRTVVTVGLLAEHLAVARHRGWAGELGEYRTGVGGVAAPVRTGGGLVVGALGVEGPVEELYAGASPVPRLVEQLANAAREISAGLGVGR